MPSTSAPAHRGQFDRRHGDRIGACTVGRPHPHVLGGNGVQLVRGGTGRQHVAETADHRRVAAALRHREQPHPDSGRLDRVGAVIGWRGGELRHLLADPLPRRRFDTGGQITALAQGQRGPDHSLTTDGVLDQQRRQARKQVGAFGIKSSPVHRRALQQQGFAEQMLGQQRHKPQQARAFQDSAAERVDHGDRPAPLHLHQPHDAQPRVRAQIQWIGVFGVHAPQHHVYGLEGAQRAHPQPAVAHHQVRALHERKAQHRGQIRLVESRLGIDAGAEHHHDGVFGRVGRGVDQGQP